jgi:bifunctional UDP-N-acetylglucosamine pyrophosphorylase/glucosamine-1-phosphate N-acetyltransferase
MINKNLLPNQAIILAAGANSRFIPFNSRGYHKSNFTIMGEPIIFTTVNSLIETGIKEMIIIVSPNDKKTKDSLRKSVSKKVKIKFCVQEKPLGMANALLGIRPDLKERFILLNPQQINIKEHLSQLSQLERVKNPFDNVCLFSQNTDQPQKYGILGLDDNRVTKVIEKPVNLAGLSCQRVLGIYLLNLDFIDFMEKVKVSEYQLEDALNKYAQKNTIIAIKSEAATPTLKYASDLFSISNYRFTQLSEIPKIHKNAKIHSTAIVSGAVVIEDGAKIYEYALIQGPCYIGKNVVVGSYCKVRKETVLEEGVELQNNVEVKHSIIQSDTHIHSGFIGDSIIGKDCRIGAGFITANRRLNRNNIQIHIKEKHVDVGSFFGSIIGDNVSIGIHCGTNPGTIIESDSSILPMNIISHPITKL